VKTTRTDGARARPAGNPSRTGAVGSFQEPRCVDQRRPRGGGWRELPEPVQLRVYLNNTWVDALAYDVNVETREVRIRWPPLGSAAQGFAPHHEIIDASRYQPAPGLFA
jgi:hypothetical protein